MEISISGKNIKLGASLEQYVEERLRAGIKKILEDINFAEIVFNKDGHLFHASILIREGHAFGMIRSNFQSDDVYHAFDGALIRLEKQIRKYKDKYKNHKAKKLAWIEEFGDSSLPATKYVLSPQSDEEFSAGDQHLIIAEKQTNIEHLTVSEAVMQMDLTNVPALLFQNKDSGKLNVVYYRADGNIAWVDPASVEV
jgi:ribosomal subunit interface protein